MAVLTITNAGNILDVLNINDMVDILDAGIVLNTTGVPFTTTVPVTTTVPDAQEDVENKYEPVLPPCEVCGEKSSGYHYGANTCEACKVWG